MKNTGSEKDRIETEREERESERDKDRKEGVRETRDRVGRN